MILVLTDGERRVWVDVILKDGCEVRCGTQTVDCQNVEPVPWFKVCVLDYLVVDVKRSTLAWVVDAPLQLRSQSQSSLPDDGIESAPSSQSHDSGGTDDVSTSQGRHEPFSPHVVVSPTSSSDRFDGTDHQQPHRHHTNAMATHEVSRSVLQTSTLPRLGATSSSSLARNASSAALSQSERTERLGRRRTVSDAQFRDVKVPQQFPTDRMLHSTLHPSASSTSETSLGSAVSGASGSGGCPDNGLPIPKVYADGAEGAVDDDDELEYATVPPEHVLTLADLLSTLENNLDYDTSVVYQIFQLCESLLTDVVSKPPPDHARWIEERCPYGRLINDVEHIENLIQIMHSHLLPFIVLHHQDRPTLECAVRRQQDAINALSEEMMTQSFLETSLASSVDGLLMRVLPGVEASLDDGFFERRFLQQVAKDVDSRGLIRRINEDLVRLQSEINDLKSKLQAGDCEDPQVRDDLQRLRGRRDNCHGELTDVLKVRELIVLLLQTARNPSGKLLPAQQSYMRACKVYEEQCHRSAGLLDKKVAALGMREALQETFLRLESLSPEERVDTTVSCILSGMSSLPKSALTASLGRVRKELLPLTDAVKEVCMDPGHPIGALHLSFCNDIIQTCTETVMPSILAFGVPRVGPVVLDNSLDQAGQRNRLQRYASLGRAMSVYEVIDPAREYIDDLAVRISDHENEVVTLLQNQFGNDSEQLHRKLYLTYERCLFTRIGHTLDDVYMVWAQKIVNQLLRVTEFVENISFPALRAHLRFPDGWWMPLFEEVVGESNAADRRLAVFSAKAPAAPFQRLLSPAAASLHQLIATICPLSKAELLTKAVQHITHALGEFQTRQSAGKRKSAVMSQVGADDLVPVVILFILYCKPEIIATLCMNCLLLEDVLPEFLRNGMHGFSMVQFQGALHVIASLLPTEQLNAANATGAGE